MVVAPLYTSKKNLIFHFSRVFVNLETSEKTYKGNEYLDPMDGYVCFHNSELMCGRLGKATLGGGNKSSLFQVYFCDLSE